MFVHNCGFVGVPCMCISECMCALLCVETISQSQCVTLGLVPQSWVGALASVYLWTKGCSKTNDLAPVSQSRRTGDEKRERSETQEGKKMIEAFRQTVKGTRESKEERKTSEPEKKES